MSKDLLVNCMIGIAGTSLLIVITAGIIYGLSWITPDAMTNQQIIKQVKLCRDNGLEARYLETIGVGTTKVECRSK